MRRTLRRFWSSLMHYPIEQQDKSMTIFPLIAPAIVLFLCSQMHNQNPASRWRGFVWRGSSTSLMVLRKRFYEIALVSVWICLWAVAGFFFCLLWVLWGGLVFFLVG